MEGVGGPIVRPLDARTGLGRGRRSAPSLLAPVGAHALGRGGWGAHRPPGSCPSRAPQAHARRPLMTSSGNRCRGPGRGTRQGWK
eukprot:12907361-Alexandrium_andersonii.AAC.1